MSSDRLAAVADRLVAARRQGVRIALAGPDLPQDYEEGFAIQDKVVSTLASPVIPTPGDHFLPPVFAVGRGHQWKSVLSRIICCWWVSATQRWATTLSRSSMVSK